MRFYSIFVIALFLVSSNANAFQFLKKSKLLSTGKVKAYTGEIHANKKEMVVDNALKGLKVTELYQASLKGKKLLSGKLRKGKIKGCGENLDGISIPIDPQLSPIVFTNIPKEMSLEWTTIQEVQLFMPPSCLSGMTKTAEDQIRYFTLGKGLKENFYMAKISKKGKSHPYQEFNFGYYKSTSDGKCTKKSLYSRPYNVDGDQGPINNITNFFGVLEVEYKSQKEKWIIFDAHGYEGDGILAIPYKSFINGDFKNFEWLILNGC